MAQNLRRDSLVAGHHRGGLSQALRLGEVLGLQVEDVDFANNKLRVRRTLERKRNLGPTKHAKLTGKRDPRDLHPID